MDPNVFYCQAGYNFQYLQPMVGNTTNLLYNQGNLETSGETDARNLEDPDVNSNARTKLRKEDGTEFAIAGIELKSGITDVMWEKREHADINGNNVYEPWEFLHASNLSGSTPRGVENTDNIYHVITCFADPKHVGALPGRYGNYSSSGYSRFSSPLNDKRGGIEHPTSEMHRMIIITGKTGE